MAEQDFDRLLASLKQINKEMETLIGKAAQARAELGKIQDPAARVSAGGKIGGYQTAAARKGQQAEAIKGTFESSLATLESVLAETEAKIKALSATEIQAGNNIAKSLEGELQKRRQINTEVEKLRAILTEINLPKGTGYIPHPPGGEDINAEFRTKVQKQAAEQAKIIEQMNMFGGSTTVGREEPPGNPWRNWKASRTAEPEATRRMSERERLEQEALNSLRARIQVEKKYTQALRQAEAQGFTAADLKRGETRGTAGIERLQFERYDEGGTQRRFDTFVNPAGKATPGISNQFRTFGQGVLRDIGEFTKWSIALAAVYGPMKKLQELTQVMIENQTKLAEAVVSVNSSFLDQGDIFDIAATQAEVAGESIGGVIDAFTQAYRATGGAGTQVERLATSQRLLSDSLILSKLSTLDQASAIDTLSAALRQTNTPLDEGTQILDKWVRVTKIANVDLASLATGFAVLGDTAEAAGIDADHLNGLLAAIAETGVASGRELANSARRVVGFFQTDQARKAIEGIGIAFEDSTGKARPLLEIIGEISQLRKSGVLGDTEFSKLTSQIGQGVRGTATITTLIENFGRVNEVAAESSRANGDAQAALAKQLDTVQTSITRLGNAFQELAQTLGSEGGFLGLITSGVNGITALVKVFNNLTSVLGKATPALLAFLAASAVLKYQGKGSIQEAISGIFPVTAQPNQGGQYYLPGMGPQLSRRERLSNFGAQFTGTNVMGGAVQGLITAALPAILNLTNKEDKYGGTKAAADVIGGVGGGIVGSLVAGSPIIGAAVGTAISEAFVNATVARKTDIFGYGAPTLGPAGPKGVGTTEADLDAALREAEAGLYRSIGFGSEGLGKLLVTGITKEGNAQIERVNEAIASRDEKTFRTILGQFNAQAGTTNQNFLGKFGISPQMLEQAFAQNQQIKGNAQYYAFGKATPEAQQTFRAAEAARLAVGGTTQDEKTAFSQLVADNKKSYEDILNTIKESTKRDLTQQRMTGDVKGAEYARRTEAVSGFDIKALQYYTALGGKVNELTGGADDAARAFAVLNNVIVGGSEDTVPQLTAIVGEIQTLVNLLGDPNAKTRIDELFPEDGIKGAKDRLEELRGTLANLINDANQQVLLGKLDIPNVQGDINKPLTKPEFGMVTEQAKALQDQFYQGFLKIPDDMYDALKGSWKEWAQIVTDSGQNFYEKVSEIDPQFFQQAMAQLAEQGKLASQQTNPFGIQQVDMTSGEGANLQATIDYYSKYLQTNFPQYQQKPEEFGVIFSDYVTDVLHGDNLAVKLALEKLVDINQKQLDGMYNIPEGATFWVPLQAAYYRPKNEGGVGGGLDASAVDGNTSATSENTNALTALTTKIGEANLDKFMLKNTLGGGGEAGGGGDRFQRITGRVQNIRIDEGVLPPDRRYDDIESLRAARTMGNVQPSTSWVQEAQTSISSFIETLKQGLNNIFSQQPAYPGGHGGFAGGGDAGGRFNDRGAATAQQPISARLDLRFDNSTQLIVDGRVLASIITPYLASDLIKLEASQGTITKRYVI